MKKNHQFCFVALIVVAGSPLASQSNFKTHDRYASGPVEIQPYAGGEYYYSTKETDTRESTPAIISGYVKRTDYLFFTAEEEEALLQFKDKIIENSVKKKLKEQRQLYLKKRKNYLWPKVVIQGMQICVPEIESSESSEWREHLTCYDQELGK